MLTWLANAWRVPELRRRLLFTALILALYRLGSWIPSPGVNADSIDQYLSRTGGIFNLLNLALVGLLVWRTGGTGRTLVWPTAQRVA